MLNLEVAVRNKAEYNFGSQTVILPSVPKTYPVKINVVNQKEGPRFQPAVKVVSVSEDKTSISTHTVITNYAAIDSDTLKTATNVMYGFKLLLKRLFMSMNVFCMRTFLCTYIGFSYL